MPTDKQIDAAAAAAAEKANGGKFFDPLFYKPEQQAFWRDVVRSALEASEAAKGKGGKPSQVSKEEVKIFSEHCVYIRSVYTFMTRIWRDSNAEDRAIMESVAPLFFEDVGKVLGNFLVIAACRVTDPADAGRGRENFTVELFANSFPPEEDTSKTLHVLRERMEKLRKVIEPARNKLGAHADRGVIREGKVLQAGSWKEWEEFWSALADFVRLLNETTFGKPFEIDAAGVFGDAEMLVKSLKQSQHFETLVNDKDPKIRDACLNLALKAA